MKTLKYIVSFLAGIVLTIACNEGIDPISQVSPGEDMLPPRVTVTYPYDGLKFWLPTELATMDIQFEATDDIELKSVAVLLDGTELTTYTDFKDYRRALEKYTYDQISTGVHVLTIRATDLSGKITDKVINFEKTAQYIKQFDGEIFYMPFNGTYMDLVSTDVATVIGAPGFAAGKLGNAYAGATDSYLSFPAAGLQNSDFSATFWYKLNVTPENRAGIIVISPPGDFDAGRTHGVHLFREGDNTQRIKLNVGWGGGESWNNGGTITGPVSDWVHIAFTVSASECVIYINGVAAETDPVGGPIDWTGCDNMSIGSGQPYFIGWSHLADQSWIDELHIFNKVLSAADIQAVMNSGK
jgi:hypothetical protein